MNQDFNNKITLKQFLDSYWYKKDLQDICKSYRLSTIGGKVELRDRLVELIKNNFDSTKVKVIKQKKKISNEPQILPKDLNEKIPDNYTCSELYRDFFKKIIGSNFHFTAYMIKYRREHDEMTFQEYIDEWIAEYERRKDKNYKPKIMESTQYNQYVRDFFKHNKDKSFKDAVKCWNYKKNTQGPKIYSDDDLKVL